MNVKEIEYGILEDDPVVIVTYDTGAMRCYINIEEGGWKDDPRAIRAKLLDEETFKRMFPDAGMPKLDGSPAAA